MKTKTKACIAVLCAVVLVAASVFATVAYLTSTAEVKNTFTYGKVAITLDEVKVNEYGIAEDASRVTGNTYKLIPGHTYIKDPTIHVSADSENCWIFAKVENGLGDAATIQMNEGWEPVAEGSNVYYYKDIVEKNANQTIFSSFQFHEDADPESYATANITVTAYAVQADGFTTAAAAWNAVGFETNQ